MAISSLCTSDKLVVRRINADSLESFKAPKDFDLSKAELILNNYDGAVTSVLKPYETRVYLWQK